MLQLYYILVHPILLYSIIIWGSHINYLYTVQRLKFLQNRATRAVVGAHFRDSVNLYYSQMKILRIGDLFKYEIAKFVYGSINSNQAIRGCRLIVTI